MYIQQLVLDWSSNLIGSTEFQLELFLLAEKKVYKLTYQILPKHNLLNIILFLEAISHFHSGCCTEYK